MLAILQKDNGEWEVQTEKGTIICEIVVNAAGLWATQIAAMVGVHLPIMPMEHQHLLFNDIPEIGELNKELPILRDPDVSYYLRQEQMGLIVGPYERDCKPWGVDGVSIDYAQDSLPPDLDRIQDYVMGAIDRVPVLTEIGIKKIVNGPITYTPDGNPLLGPLYGLRNFYIASGLSFGIIQSGGTGRYMAEWIVHGQPGIDLWEVDPRRFGEWAGKKYTLDKIQEVYRMEYAIVYPNEERPAARPIKTSPLHDRLAAQGAAFGFRYGWERPNWFSPKGVEPVDQLSFRRTNWFAQVGKECKAVRERVGVIDFNSFSKYEVSGPEAEAFLDHLCANSLPQEIGKIVVTQMLTRKGGTECDLTVARLEKDRFYIISGAAVERHDLHWMESKLPNDGSVVIANITNSSGVLIIAGPRSRDVLRKLTESDLSNDAFPFMTFRNITVGYVPVRALRLNFVGELGWELHHPVEYQRTLYESLMAAGEEFGIVNFGMRALDSLRLEKGYRMWGLELISELTPLEAGLERFVKINKGEFIGREALLQQRNEGTFNRLVCLTINSGDADAIGDEPVFSGGQVVGRVTSGGYGHVVERSIALAYVRRDMTEPGVELEVEILGERLPATVVPAPLYDPQNLRLKG